MVVLSLFLISLLPHEIFAQYKALPDSPLDTSMGEDISKDEKSEAQKKEKQEQREELREEEFEEIPDEEFNMNWNEESQFLWRR